MGRILNKEEFDLFKKILGASQEGLLTSIGGFLQGMYSEERVVITDDYIIAFGDIPVGIVAHMDTVHVAPVTDLFYDKEQNVMWSPQGLGADDRAGVYSMVEILKRGLRPTLILTTDEETGGIGASILIQEYKDSPCDLNFLIELDRRGREDCVFYDCDNEEFEKYIEDYGFKTDWGSFSDISYIAPTWGMAAVNLSIGYMDEHSLKERLHVDWMFDTIDKVCEILQNVREEDKFIYVESDYARNYRKYYDVAFGNSYYEWKDSKGEMCWGCLGNFDKEVIITTKDGGTYCGDCYPKHYSTCIECGEDFKDETKTHLLCEKCREVEVE